MRPKTLILGCSFFLISACATQEKDVGVISLDDKVKDRATAISLGIAACVQEWRHVQTDESFWRARLTNDTWFVWENKHGHKIEECDGNLQIRIAKRDGKSSGCGICTEISETRS